MDHFSYLNGQLHAENVAITEIAKKIGTPFYCYSKATLTHHYDVFAKAFAGLETQICYAVKANDNVAILKEFAKLGSGGDCVSKGEIMRCLKAGIPADKIVFSGVGKTAEELRYALEQKVGQINVESEPELELLNSIAVSLNKKAAIAFRVNPDVDANTHHKIATGRSHDKFGISYETAREIYKKAASLPGIKIRSVAVHIGSQLSDLAPFEKAFTKIAALVEILRQDGHSITHLDLGGGLGIPYHDLVPPSPADYAAMVKRTVGHLGCKLVFEPGRLLVGNAGILVSKVIYLKKSGQNRFLIIDAAMNDLIRPALYEAYHQIIPVTEPTAATTSFHTDIVGPVCETGDVFGKERLLPELDSDDLIVIRSAGAYGSVMAGTYNSRPLLAEVMVDGDQTILIRKRQTLEELIERDETNQIL